jgi:hypothetical protein
LQWAILCYFVLVNGGLTALSLSALIDVRRHRLDAWQEGRWRLLSSNLTPSISMLAPAFNEDVRSARACGRSSRCAIRTSRS